MGAPAWQPVPLPLLELGEGPLWDEDAQRFLVVDIHGRAVHAWHPDSGAMQAWRLPERIGWLIPRHDRDGFVAGLQSGFVRLWLEPTLRLEPIGSPHPGEPAVRLNDAKADPWGRIWAGSMNNADHARPDGRLARLDPDGRITIVERGIRIGNGPAISADGRTLMHTDSGLRSIYRYRLDAGGRLSDKTLWRRFEAADGAPDGMSFDADGALWIAFWGAGCVRRFALDGTLLQQIELPARQITSMAFGGPDQRTLLVTSAREGLDAAALRTQPLAGASFVLRPGVPGLAACRFGNERS
ncbi:MAG: SMP-30/gluconolactonase/LRE family protein [Burkholderiales bacterium]|nr:SMP-30/gluconolactonase/LRE family protein [Burkholderiales bacterium]